MTAENLASGIADSHPAPLQKRHYIVATAGHVDHGKSSLVRALTGTDPDRLPEEKARQITIDLGFAELALGPDLHAAIIDVPGHEDFVANMLAGVGSIDLALLVVAADDGWMPQTEEHLQILEYLGVNRAVVALTKTDIADAAEVEGQIRERLSSTPFAAAPIVRTAVQNLSGLTGQVSGLPELKESLAAGLSRSSPQRDVEKPRLFVDRAFGLHGIGTIVTGALVGGTFAVGQSIRIQPRNVTARIRSLQSHNRTVNVAEPGRRIALNLPDVTPDADVRRGDVVTTERFESVSVFTATIHRSSHATSAPPLKSGASVFLHHGAGRVAARIVLRNRKKLMPGESDTAHVRLVSPLLVFVGDRFVARDPSQRHTLAGGTIVGRGLGTGAIPQKDNVALCAEYEINAFDVLDQTHVLEHSRFSREEIDAALTNLEQAGKIVLINGVAVQSQTWRDLRAKAVATVRAAHDTHPDRPGIQMGGLRSALGNHPQKLIDALIADLLISELVQVGSFIALKSHQPELPPELRAEAVKTIEGLSAEPRNPGIQSAPRAVISFLISKGSIVELARNVLMTTDVFVQMKDEAVQFLRLHERATASELRQALRTSRRVIIPFLELLDRQHVTRRIGDQRMLASEIDAAKIT